MSKNKNSKHFYTYTHQIPFQIPFTCQSTQTTLHPMVETLSTNLRSQVHQTVQEDVKMLSQLRKTAPIS